ncbi:MAG: hypothetical protein JO354_03260 [Verrucomicrobia bacterium]|nr:hypothetical protein [Verrucomicrobiota bacterium]
MISLLALSRLHAHQLVLTENSSANLTVTYDGSSSGIRITDLGPDSWIIDLGFPFGGATRGAGYPWLEPGNSGLENVVQFFPAGTTTLFVFSEISGNFGSPVHDHTLIRNVNTDLRDNKPISIRFDDDGDGSAKVPDTGATLTLLLLSLTALLGMEQYSSSRG